jgi:hypothetical protein
MGIEATYWGKTSIMAGHSMYETLDVVHRPVTHQELVNMILDNTLQPKDKQGTYVFGYYYAASGEPFKYYQPSSYKEGTYRGVKLDSILTPKEQTWMNRYWVYRKYPVIEKFLRKKITKLVSV